MSHITKLVIKQEWKFCPLGLTWFCCSLRQRFWVGVNKSFLEGRVHTGWPTELFTPADLVPTMWPHQPWTEKFLLNVAHKKHLLSRSMLFYLSAYGQQTFTLYQSINMCDGGSLYGRRGWRSVSESKLYKGCEQALCVSAVHVSQ